MAKIAGLTRMVCQCGTQKSRQRSIIFSANTFHHHSFGADFFDFSIQDWRFYQWGEYCQYSPLFAVGVNSVWGSSFPILNSTFQKEKATERVFENWHEFIGFSSSPSRWFFASERILPWKISNRSWSAFRKVRGRIKIFSSYRILRLFGSSQIETWKHGVEYWIWGMENQLNYYFFAR